MLKSDFIAAAADMFRVSPEALISYEKPKALMPARFALYKALRLRGWSYPQIGQTLNRDHSSVIYGVRRADWLMDRDPGYAKKVRLLAELKIVREQTVAIAN